MCDGNSVNQNMVTVSPEDIQNVLKHFSKKSYEVTYSDSISNEALLRSIELMKIDYNIFLVNNGDGLLNPHYPAQLIIPEYEHFPNPNSAHLQTNQRTTTTIYESMYDAQKLRDLIGKANVARCRMRFPLPAILYKGKFICRSATLASRAEVYGRLGMMYLLKGPQPATGQYDGDDESLQSERSPILDRFRSLDIKLLKTFNVGIIVDFMVEKKKVKFGLNVSSSEKVDKENRYSDFTIISVPYPGCEFFKEFRDSDYTAQNLIFDWSQGHVDASICVPDDSISSQLAIKWDDYKGWDLVTMTQKYMRLILKYLQDSSSSLLIHCISGWDRTPLFISLLRLSLWADGLAHHSLDAQQILYLTICYDWMLFGHSLNERIEKGEEIFFFCFYMLKYLVDDDYSISGSLRHRSSSKLSDRCCDKSVMRTDSDLQLEGMLLEQDSQGSNISLNSSCSSVSSKSQEPTSSHSFQLNDEPTSSIYLPCDMSNSLLWSPQTRRTSPVTVPVASRIRQRQESSSSLSVGSWQMISGTGSLRGSDSASTDSNGTNPNRCMGQSSQDSSCTVIDQDIDTLGSIRKERLLKVRSLFYQCYSTTIGLKFKNDSSLSSLFGNFAERVGLKLGD